MQIIGLGCDNYEIAVYIANQPNMAEYQNLLAMTPLAQGEIFAIGQACGNGWRKVFNVYAKLLYALNNKHFNFAAQAPTWQHYRDNFLLQSGSKLALLFSSPQLLTNTNKSTQKIHIICGRTYAKQLLKKELLPCQFIWLDDEFAIDKRYNIIICPYFDYRQLSNIKIFRLAQLMSELIEQSR